MSKKDTCRDGGVCVEISTVFKDNSPDSLSEKSFEAIDGLYCDTTIGKETVILWDNSGSAIACNLTLDEWRVFVTDAKEGKFDVRRNDGIVIFRNCRTPHIVSLFTYSNWDIFIAKIKNCEFDIP